MICEQCHGTRLVVTAEAVRPCEECGGLGVVHCCEGLQAQPEPQAADDLAAVAAEPEAEPA